MFTPATYAASRSAISSQALASGPMPSGLPDGATTDLFGLVPVRANLSVRQAKELGLMTSGTCGPTSTTSSKSAALQSAGWRIAENPIRDAMNEADWYAWRPGRTSARECCCNDKPPSVTVNPFQFDIRGHVSASAEIRLTGEIPNGRWVDFKVYSVPMTEVMDALPSAMQTLEAAWVAAWDTAGKTKDAK